MKIKKNLFIYFCLFIFSLSTLISSFPLPFSKKGNSNIVLDSDITEGVPHRFRDLTNLNISGSAEFTPSQVKNLKDAINKPDICIVDLRQESHGFINDFAISFYSIGNDLNNGFTTEETINTENKLLNSIKIDSNVDIFSKIGRLRKTINVQSISNENTEVEKNGLKYQRFAVKDGGIPSLSVVDEFVNFIKNKPEDQHLHYHCDAGEGRTTTFMVLDQIMHNEGDLSLDQILSYQYNMGGIILTDDEDRASFIDTFYDYVKENKDTNYATSYSQWISQ